MSKSTTTLASNASAPTSALYFLGLVYLAMIAGVFVSGQSSDRTGERKWLAPIKAAGPRPSALPART